MCESKTRIELDRAPEFAFGSRPVPVVMTDVGQGGVRLRERVVCLNGGDCLRLRAWTHFERRRGADHHGPEMVVAIGKSGMRRPVCRVAFDRRLIKPNGLLE